MLFLVALFACKPAEVTFYDKFGVHDEAEGSDAAEDSPLGPYLAGSAFHVYAHTSPRLAGDLKLELFSTDESVLKIHDQAVLDDVVTAEVEVLAEGDARLELWRKDWNIAGTAISVHDAAYGAVVWGPGVLSGVDEAMQSLVGPNVVVGGTTTFEVRYTDTDGSPLLGSGIAEVIGGEPSLSALTATEYEDVAGDWITIGGVSPGSGEIEVRMGPVTLATTEISVVDSAAIASVALYVPDEAQALPGQMVYAAAHGFDAKGEAVYGLPVAWDLDGTDTGTAGELFPYTYDSTASAQSLAISVNGKTVAHDIKSGDPADDISGCNVAPKRVGVGIVALIGLAAARRRRVVDSKPIG